MAPRPAHSTLDLTRIQSTGFTPPTMQDSWAELLEESQVN